jgi:dTDP-4-amino-4,6-dideoxygalactose transaminase
MDLPAEDDRIALSEPDLGAAELGAVLGTLRAPARGRASAVARFESAFAAYAGRDHGVAYAGGALALLACLRALGIGADDEVVAPSYAWHQIAHAIAIAGARPAFADIDYWSGTVTAASVATRIGPRTKAILAGNTNGHPAPWAALRELAAARGLVLIEDSTEAIGSQYRGRRVGGFGDCAIFDFSLPAALSCGEGAMIVTDDGHLASELRYLRRREWADRGSVSVGSRIPLQAPMSEMAAALGLEQLARRDEILARRKAVEDHYARHMQSFEGIKPPYRAPEVEELHGFVYLAHLGTRFTCSARNQIVEDLATAAIEAAPYCLPLHQQFAYARYGCARGDLLVTEKIADRGLALPFHAGLAEDEIEFIVRTAKDSSINVGAGAAIY